MKLSTSILLTCSAMTILACGAGTPGGQMPTWLGSTPDAAQSNCDAITPPQLFCTVGRAHAASESAARQIAEAEASSQLVQGLLSRLTASISKETSVSSTTDSSRAGTSSGGQLGVQTPLGNVSTPKGSLTVSGNVDTDEATAVDVVKKHFTQESAGSLFGIRTAQNYWEADKGNYHVIVTVPYESLRAYVEGLENVNPKAKERIMRAVSALEQAHAASKTSK